MALSAHLTARTLCNTLLAQVCNWWYWFLPTFSTFHSKLLRRACPDGKCSKDSKDAVWSVCTGALKAMFDEFRTVTVSAVGAHLASTPAIRTGLILHSTLQLHRIMEEFVADQFENHAVVQRHVVLHISDNYMPRGEVESKLKELSGIRIKANEHDKAIEVQSSKLGVMRSEVELLKKKQK